MKLTQGLIILLLVANLSATIWFGMDKSTAPLMNPSQKSAVHNLPPIITHGVRDELLSSITAAFNAKDYDALYNMLGPAAKAQVSMKEALVEFEKLIKYFHSIEGGAYIHSEFASTQGNTMIYVLHYSVTLSEESAFGTSGKLTITIAVQDSEYQVYGFRINAG